MKKFLLSAVLALTVITLGFSHGDKPNKAQGAELRAELIEMIGTPPAPEFGNSERVNINFLINNKNEVVILSTSNADYDGYIKSRLNYQKLEKSSGVINKQYTFPLVIQKS